MENKNRNSFILLVSTMHFYFIHNLYFMLLTFYIYCIFYLCNRVQCRPPGSSGESRLQHCQGHSAVKQPRRFGVYEVQTSELVHSEIINLR